MNSGLMTPVFSRNSRRAQRDSQSSGKMWRIVERGSWIVDEERGALSAIFYPRSTIHPLTAPLSRFPGRLRSLEVVTPRAGFPTLMKH